jgi:hypothetical protein
VPSAGSGAAPLRAVLRGLLSGLAATGAMSILFGLGQAAGAMDRLPPRLIVDRLLPVVPQGARGPVAGTLHVGYGAAGGAAYALVAPPTVRGPLTGLLFGLAVWAGSYEGWVPAAGVLPPAHRDRPRRAVTILLAHVVYGATLGVVAQRLSAG